MRKPVLDIEQSLARIDSIVSLRAASERGWPDAVFADQSRYYRGKVRDIEFSDRRLSMYHSDRLTAFDRYIDLVPFKGKILCHLNSFWLRRVASDLPTHFIEQTDDRTILCHKTRPIKIEVVVRGYLAGSMARLYASGERHYCGHVLPEGLEEFRPLERPIITPTTKAAVFEHDEPSSALDLIASGACSKLDWERIQAMALELFREGQSWSLRKGWILVDTKYEFGWRDNGEICVIDEIHTPDSSRFWVQETYEDRLRSFMAPEMFDKEPIRRWLMAQGFSGYGDVPQVPYQELVALARDYWRVAASLMDN